MKIIGVTGGVGSGKSELLWYIKKHYSCEIVFADILAKELQEPGGAAYKPLIKLLGGEILREDGRISHEKMADKIFGNGELLKKVDGLIHPLVISEILSRKDAAEKSGEIPFFFIEAALLIENGFGKICDEMWYIYAKEEVRRERLIVSRGYSHEKIDAIMGKQLPEEAFRAACQVVIDNSGSFAESVRQIDQVWRGLISSGNESEKNIR